jgi:hypothetical protein
MKRNIKMTTNTTLTRPDNLDPSKLHSPTEVRAWEAAVFGYHEQVREEAALLRKREEAKVHEQNKALSPDEYFQEAVEREAIKQARLAEIQAAEQAKEDAAAAYLASSPDVAEISTSNPYKFITEVIHWASKGYVLPDDADITMLPTLCMCKLHKPVAARRAKQ